MSDNKKYYYLKLKENHFDTDEMIILESMPDGLKYSNILLKLYLRSLKYDGRLMVNNRIPFNPTMLAQVTRHSVGDVEKAVEIFKQLELIEVLDNGAIYMSDIQNYIGQSSSEADRKRSYRLKIESEKKEIGQMSGHISDKNPPEIEIEKDLNINPKGQGSAQKPKTKLNLSDAAAAFRQKLINSKYVGHLAPVMVEGEKEDVYINEQGLLYTKNRTDKQLVSSTLNEIWEQLQEAHAAKYGVKTVNPIQNLKINKIGA